jgi:hypothetical protein
MAVPRHRNRAGYNRGEWDESGHCRGGKTQARGVVEDVNDDDQVEEAKVGVEWVAFADVGLT